MPALNVQPREVNLTNYYLTTVLALRWGTAIARPHWSQQNTCTVIRRAALLLCVYHTMLVYMWNAVCPLCLRSCTRFQFRQRRQSKCTYIEGPPERSLLLLQMVDHSYYFLITTVAPCLTAPTLQLHYTILVTRVEFLLTTHTPINVCVT